MKILLIGDLHLVDKPPSGCFDTYLMEQWTLLDECADLARSLQCEFTVFAGDIFHIKTPSRNSHELVSRFIDKLTLWPGDVFIVPGNHDVMHDRMESLSSQPLGVVAASGVAIVPSELFQYIIPNSSSVLQIAPWGVEPKPQGSLSLTVSHAPIFPDGLVPPWEGWAASEEAAKLEHGYCYYGHIHEQHGVYLDPVETVTFCNAGALTRGSLSEQDKTRVVSVATWEASTGFTLVPLKNVLPAAEILRIEERDAEVQRAAGYEEMVAELASMMEGGLSADSIDAILADLRNGDLTQATYAKCETLLRQADEQSS